MEINKCKKCGYDLFPMDKECSRCGSKVISSVNASNQASSKKSSVIDRNKIKTSQGNNSKGLYITLGILLSLLIMVSCAILIVFSKNKIHRSNIIAEPTTNNTIDDTNDVIDELKSGDISTESAQETIQTTETDDVHIHEWIEATCYEPKRCSLCNETEGSELGHSVEMGVCDRCGTFVNFEVIQEILNLYGMVQDYSTPMGLSDAIDNEESVFGMYCAALNDTLDYSMAQSYLKDIVKACGNYSYLSKTKDAAQKAADSAPVSLNGDDKEALIDFLEREDKYWRDESYVFDTMKPYETDIKKAQENQEKNK